jgi:hypothetical protein
MLEIVIISHPGAGWKCSGNVLEFQTSDVLMHNNSPHSRNALNHVYEDTEDITKDIRSAKYVASPTWSLPVALEAVGELPVEVEVALGVAAWSLTITYISPVASEEINILPFPSKAMPTGLKQLVGHTESSVFAKISVSALVPFAGATGSPLAKAIRDTL